jgi:hypothetical protein
MSAGAAKLGTAAIVAAPDSTPSTYSLSAVPPCIVQTTWCQVPAVVAPLVTVLSGQLASMLAMPRNLPAWKYNVRVALPLYSDTMGASTVAEAGLTQASIVKSGPT